MAHGGKEKLPRLRITFEELQRRSKLLDTSSTKVPNVNVVSELKRHEEVENPSYSGGILHLKPTTPLSGSSTVNADKKTTRKVMNGCFSATNRLSSPPGRQNHTSTLAEAELRPPPGPSNITPGKRDQNPAISNDKMAKSVNNRRSRERNIEPSHPDRMVRSTSHRQNRAREKEGPRQRAQSEGVRSGGKKPQDEELAEDWSRYDNRKLERALSKWSVSGDLKKLDPIMALCQRMQECAEKVLGQNFELFSKLDISSKLWTTGHYQIIETLRRRGDDDVLGKFLIDSTEFYSRLPDILESKLDFRLSQLTTNQASFTSKTHLRMVMMAAVVCHFWYICLGDLSRYQQQSLGRKANWSIPRKHYLQANRLAPKDGKPYNQLALISINTHRRLDAVYYYMRGLSSKQPFQSAYDSLVGIFADTNRKAKRLEEDERMARERESTKNRKKKEEKQPTRKPNPHHGHSHSRNKKHTSKGMEGENPEAKKLTSGGRKEVWIMPGAPLPGQGVVQVDQVTQESAAAALPPSSVVGEAPPLSPPSVVDGDPGEDTVQQRPLTPVTLKQAVKKMTSAFLIMQGKLFTRTDIQTLEGSVKKMLHCLRGLLKGEELRMEYSIHLFKMMVISLFSIHHAAETHLDNQATKSYHSGLALSVALRMATVLLDSCGEKIERFMSDPSLRTPEEDLCKQMGNLEVDIEGHLSEHKLSSVVMDEDGEVLDFFAVLLPSVRILFDWFLCQEELYSQFLDTMPESILHDFWTSTVKFLNLSSKLSSLHHLNSTAADGGGGGDIQNIPTDSPCLWEDRMLAGFMPLKKNLGTRDTFSLPDFKGLQIKDHREQTVVRMKLISAFCQLLCNSKKNTNYKALIMYSKQSGQFSTQFSTKGDGGGDGDGDGESGGGDDDGESCGGGEDQKIEFLENLEDVTTSEEEDEMSLEIEVEDNSLSLGFSDSEDSVIEELSEDEEGVVMATTQGSEVKPEQHDDGNSQIEHLKAQREKLAKVIEERSKAMAIAKTVLDEASRKACEEVTIKPRYLVPDTNCFVDMLDSLKTLVKGADFIVAVPLIVISELEGLSKNSGSESHSVSKVVATGAKNALEYIKSSFQAKIPNIRVLTTQGNLLSSLAFRAEVTGMASNDDHILESCLQLHLKKKSASLHKVVLLTDDRNLRVKAHANSQPVKDIPGFMKLLQK